MDTNILDNESTLLLKLADSNNLYTGYITIVTGNELTDVKAYYTWKDYRYLLIEDVIKTHYNNKLVAKSYYELKKYYKFISDDELYYAYYITTKDLVKVNNLYKDVNDSTTSIYDEDYMDNMKKNVSRKIKKATAKLDNIITAQSELVDINVDYPVSNNVVFSIDKTFELLVDSRYKGLDIFNEIECSENIVFVKYNYEGNNYYKCYSEFSTDNIVGEKLYISNEIIYINVKHHTLKKHIRVDINMNNMKVIVHNLKNQDEFDVVLEILTKGIKVVNFVDIKVTDGSIGSKFKMYGINIDKYIFSYAMLNYDIFNLYLYTEETNNHVSIKKRFDVNLRSDMNFFYQEGEIPFSVFCIVTNNVTEVDIDERLIDGSKTNIKKGTKYINFKITKCTSMNKAKEYINIVTRLIKYYMTKDENDRTIEDEIIRQVRVEILAGYKKETRSSKSTDKSSNRRDRDIIKENKKKTEGDLIIFKDYSTICQSAEKGNRKINKQPEIIDDPKEIEGWRKMGHTILTFPDPKSKLEENDVKSYKWVCKDEDYKYPGVMVVKPSLRKYARIPYAQCCFATDMTKNWREDFNEGLRNNYARYMMGVYPDDKKSNITMKTIKTLNEGMSGDLPKIIAKLLGSTKEIPIRRLGVERSVNSILHCLYKAIGDEKYLESDNKELYVLKKRMRMINSIYPELLKEEFYEYDNDYIYKYVASYNFLDPVYVIKLLEHWFGANIFMFTNISNYEFEMLFPRYKNFYIRSYYPGLPTYLIYYNTGFKSENLEYPQCELIYYSKNNKNVYNFKDEALNLCEKMVNSLQDYKIINTNLSVYENFLKDFVVNGNPTHQILDSYGKTRGIVYRDITIITPPIHNFNLPSTNVPTLASASYVIKKLGKPSSVTYESGKITGFWYNYNTINKFIYVPIISEERDLKETSYIYDNPISLTGEDSESRIDRMYGIKRNLKLLTEVLKWLISIAVYNKQTLNSFISTYLIHDKLRVNTYDYYKFGDISRFLPRYTSVDEAIKYLYNYNSNVFDNGKVILHDKDFYNKIVYFCKPQYYIMKSKPEKEIKDKIEKFYYFNRDFKAYSNTIVLINKSEFNYFLYNQENDFVSRYMIYDKIDYKFFDRYDPFIFRNYDGKLYLIQNVIEGNIGKAMTNAYNWKYNNYNTGFNPIELKEAKNKSVNFYMITDEGRLSKISDVDNDLDILCYGNLEGVVTGKSKYAAMLALKN